MKDDIVIVGAARHGGREAFQMGRVSPTCRPMELGKGPPSKGPPWNVAGIDTPPGYPK